MVKGIGCVFLLPPSLQGGDTVCVFSRGHHSQSTWYSPIHKMSHSVSQCVSMTRRIAQNLNIAIKKWSCKHLNLEKPIKYEVVFQTLILRYIFKVSWQHLLCFFRLMWRSGSCDQFTLNENDALRLGGGGERICFSNSNFQEKNITILDSAKRM